MFTNKYSISILNLCEHVSCINMAVIYNHILNLHNFHMTCRYGASIQNIKTIYDLMNNIKIHTAMPATKRLLAQATGSCASMAASMAFLRTNHKVGPEAIVTNGVEKTPISRAK